MVARSHGGDEHTRQYVVPTFWVLGQLNTPSGLVLGSHVLAVELRTMLDRNYVPHIHPYSPETCLGVTDKSEELHMYESFEQFTSSPADQRIEEVQCVPTPTPFL